VYPDCSGDWFGRGRIDRRSVFPGVDSFRFGLFVNGFNRLYWLRDLAIDGAFSIPEIVALFRNFIDVKRVTVRKSDCLPNDFWRGRTAGVFLRVNREGGQQAQQ
jgi:hypothetical protein